MISHWNKDSTHAPRQHCRRWRGPPAHQQAVSGPWNCEAAVSNPVTVTVAPALYQARCGWMLHLHSAKQLVHVRRGTTIGSNLGQSHRIQFQLLSKQIERIHENRRRDGVDYIDRIDVYHRGFLQLNFCCTQSGQ